MTYRLVRGLRDGDVHIYDASKYNNKIYRQIHEEQYAVLLDGCTSDYGSLWYIPKRVTTEVPPPDADEGDGL